MVDRWVIDRGCHNFLFFLCRKKLFFAIKQHFFQINLQAKGYLFEKEIAIEFEKLARERVPTLKA